nr:hypothetical protein [Buttiauxella sp. A2-C1_F]
MKLSGGAGDVLYALFFRGALQPGDLPSKSGARELRAAGFVEASHTATPFGGDNYFVYLTVKGQAFAIQYLAETRFGVDVNTDVRSSLNGSPATGGKLESGYSIKMATDDYGKPYMASMAIGVDAAAHKTRLSDDMRDAVIDAVRESKLFAELAPQSKVEFLAEHFTVTSGAKEQPQSGNVITVNINTQHNDEELSTAIAKAIQASLRPGGLIHNATLKR